MYYLFNHVLSHLVIYLIFIYLLNIYKIRYLLIFISSLTYFNTD